MTTKDEMVEAAATMFARGGFRTANMREVAEALGVSRSSIYYHFPEKSDLLNEIIVHNINNALRRVSEIVDYPLPASQRLKVLIRAVLRLELETPGISLRLIVRAEGETLRPEDLNTYIAKRDEYEGYFRRLVDEGIAAGEFRPVNTKITTFALLGMLEEFDGWFDPAGPLDSDEVADIFGDLILSSLAVTNEPGPHSTQ